MNENFLNFHDAVLILTFIECLFLVGLLKVLPTARPQSRTFLSFFFVLNAVWVVVTLLSWNDELRKLWINTTLLTPVFTAFALLLQGPCLYLYFRSLIETIDFKYWKLWLHLLPFGVVALAIIAFDVNGVAWILKTPMPAETEAAARFAWTVIRCLPIVYIIACFSVVRRLHEQQHHLYSVVSPAKFKLDYFVLWSFVTHWLWAFFQYLVGNFLSEETNDIIGNLEDYLVVVQLNALLVLGLINAKELLNVTQYDAKKMANQPLDESKIELVEHAINEQKVYLENNINLDRFADAAGLKPRALSLILHSHYKLNFFDFINGLRVEEAKRLLAAPEMESVSILDILHQSGFNSQSSFQRIFKRATGCTPSEYRRNARISSDTAQ
uniref:helix-turn-helix transcriptional regulator n=1 Tax=Cellvibrio fontiphilus TaxID=1815559 RepID=UPI002B4BFE7B|nr:helix-turn-helix transcriptional regulator [Cellvibrio fontiphilus]